MTQREAELADCLASTATPDNVAVREELLLGARKLLLALELLDNVADRVCFTLSF
jgi:hypothetical protein